MDDRDETATSSAPIDGNVTHQGRAPAPIRFPPLRTELAVPGGAFLAVQTKASEGGKSFVSRSGFLRLASSSHLVTDLTSDTDALLDEFARCCKSATASWSPLQTFARLFQQPGWHRAQMFWSEHEPTRQAMYDVWTRVIAESFRPLLVRRLVSLQDGAVVIEDGDCSAHMDAIARACGALLALYLIKSTSVLTKRDCALPGNSTRIAIEADLLHAMCALPTLASGLFATRTDGDELCPMDDVVFVLRSMLGYDALAGQANGRQRNCLDVLLPASYGARPRLVENYVSTKAEGDRHRRHNGSVVDPASGQVTYLTRSEYARALVREALDEPQQLPLPSKHTDAPLQQGQAHHAPLAALDDEQDPLALVHGPSLRTGTFASLASVPAPKTTHLARLDGTLDALEDVEARFEAQRREAFGNDGIAGRTFAEKTASFAQTLLDVTAVAPTDRTDALGQVSEAVEGTSAFLRRTRVSNADILDFARARSQQDIIARLRQASRRIQAHSQELEQSTTTPPPS